MQPAMLNNDDYYRLGHDIAASGRLTLQHFLIKDLMGYNLHPTITTAWHAESQSNSTWTSESPLTAPTPKRIADVACGNGIWSTEVLSSHSTTSNPLSITAFDISPTQFPPRHTWPQNLTFETWNIYEPPPPEHEGKYDLVNIKLLIFVIRDGDPTPVIRNALKLLKPGGFLQWIDYDMCQPIGQNPYKRSAELFVAKGTHRHEWVAILDRYFAKEGMCSTSEMSYMPKPEMRKFWTDNFVMAQSEIRDAYNTPETDALYAEMRKNLAEEGGFVIWPTVSAIGRKAW